jgi:hypothetical protein
LFNREIGTASALLRAAGWLDLEVEVWEEPDPTIHFSEYQLELLSEVPMDLRILCKMVRAAKIAQPARTRFRRIFNKEWNVGRFMLDSSDWGDLLSNYSGTLFDNRMPCGKKTGLIVSLGRAHWMVDQEEDGDPLKLISTDEPAIAWIVRERLSPSRVNYQLWPNVDEDYYLSMYPDYMVANAVALEEPGIDGTLGDDGSNVLGDDGSVELPD